MGSVWVLPLGWPVRSSVDSRSWVKYHGEVLIWIYFFEFVEGLEELVIYMMETGQKHCARAR
jgi:hypothetical protein